MKTTVPFEGSLNTEECKKMNTVELLDELEQRAFHDRVLRKTLLETHKEDNPLEAFCRKCREYGYELYPMEIINAGEEFYGNMRRSTNGGGENSPKLDGEDDFYELFMTALLSADENDMLQKENTGGHSHEKTGKS